MHIYAHLGSIPGCLGDYFRQHFSTILLIWGGNIINKHDNKCGFLSLSTILSTMFGRIWGPPKFLYNLFSATYDLFLGNTRNLGCTGNEMESGPFFIAQRIATATVSLPQENRLLESGQACGHHLQTFNVGGLPMEPSKIAAYSFDRVNPLRGRRQQIIAGSRCT